MYYNNTNHISRFHETASPPQHPAHHYHYPDDFMNTITLHEHPVVIRNWKTVQTKPRQKQKTRQMEIEGFKHAPEKRYCKYISKSNLITSTQLFSFMLGLLYIFQLA